MPRLLACPVCRELFGDDEATTCRVCGVELVPMDKLPPSAEALAEAPYVPPEDRTLHVWFWRRGRGALLLLAALGLALFFCPWVSLSRPDEVLLSGLDLARGNAGWLWGGAIGWFILLPLVFTRRTVTALRGIRIICATFAAMTLGEVVLLLVRRPTEQVYFSYGVDYVWGLYASGAVALAALIVAARLGGRLDDRSDLPLEAHSNETSHGQIVH